MRTKHLFYTAAMAALFAACVNDDFETIGQQGNVINDGRPVVSDVKLKFTQGGADTRLVYEGQGKGYAWQTNDTIGALLMDNVSAKNPEEGNLTWLEKYRLVNDIHTSYPFTYSTAGETWGCNTKMLEGNYFFAYPWEDYKGERRVKHSLTNQAQQGVGAEVRAESYAKNQFFIGYSQIMAGTSDKDVLNEVEMVPVLGAIQLQIVNTGTQTYHINKVVLKGDQLHSTLTFDPTDADYGTWNLDNNSSVDWIDNATTFNYANYTGNEEDTYVTSGADYVYNITGEEIEPYERNTALRKVIKEDPTTTDDDFAQIIIKGTEAERALISTKTDEDAVAYVLIMANAVEKVNGLTMDIYTDEGIVRNIDLTIKNEGTNGEPDDYKAITTSVVKAIGPSVVNTIGVQIDDNSFLTPSKMDIYTDEDLLQFIQWNVNETGAQEITANIVKPGVTLTKEMAELLAENEDIEITFTSVNEKGESLGYLLTLAEDVPADFLDLENVTINCGINVEGSLVLTDDSKLTNITVAEDATLNINKKLAPKSKITITNNGVLNVAEDVNVSANVAIENNGELNIAADADVRGTITNNLEAEVNNEGYILDIVNKGGTEKNGVVNLGKEATIAGGTNEGIIRTDNGSKVSVEGSGEIIFVVGADVTTENTVSYEAADGEDIDDKTYAELYEAGVSKLILKGDVELTAKGIAPATAASFTKVVAEDGSSLTVDDEVSLTVAELLIKGNAMTNGAINATAKVTVEKDVVLTNNGAITTAEFVNNGTVNNRGSVNTKSVSGSKGKDGFRYNAPYVNDGKFETALQNAVTLFMDGTSGNSTNAYKDAYKVTLGDAETKNTFLYFMNSASFANEEAVKALKACEEFKSLTQAQLNAAVKAIEVANKTTLVDALKEATLTAQTTAYETKTGTDVKKAAYAAFKQAVLQKDNNIGTLTVSYSVARAINQLSETDIDGILATANPQMYIWQQTTCPLYDVMVVALAHDKKTWAAAMPDKLGSWANETGNIASWSGLQTWMNAVATTNSTAVIMTDATTVMKKYASSYSSWNYGDGQFKALSEVIAE